MSNTHLKQVGGGQSVELEAANPTGQTDAAANDSDKTFTVPAGKVWEVAGIWVTLATTATVGNRRLRIDISIGGTLTFRVHASAVQTASITKTYVAVPGFGVAGVNTTADEFFIPLPKPLRLPATATIRVYDSTAVDAAADDLTIGILYDERDTGAVA